MPLVHLSVSTVDGYKVTVTFSAKMVTLTR